jgi:murein DD-endopeptidase MepM/ murein hydrolase activator NlpD
MALTALPPEGLCIGHDSTRWSVVEPSAAMAAPARAAGNPASASEPAPAPVETPQDDAAEMAARLGLGGQVALNTLMRWSAPRSWLEAVDSERTDTFLWPVAGGTPFRGFGNTRRERRELLHKGVDIGAPVGTPVAAVVDGLVGFVGDQPGYGTTVVILDARGAVTLYAHLAATTVVAGERVRAGQVVGAVGVTGITLCPHLHFELRVRGEPRDPMPHFRRGLVPLAATHPV